LADRERGFDLQNPPLLRLCLLRTADDRHRLIFTCHHILMDGWSNSRMFGEVLQDYAGHPVPRAVIATSWPGCNARTRTRRKPSGAGS
jgi:hypothetical protein